MSQPHPKRATAPLAAEEIERRERAVSDARVSIELEGFAFSPAAEEDNRAFVRGEIDIAESIARSKARYARRKS